MDAPRIFTPEYYARLRDLERVSWWNAGMRDVAALVMKTVKLPVAGRLLDVGCGSGQTLTWFAKLYPEWTTVGFDIARDGLASARASGFPAVLRASALAMPVRSASIDLVVTLDVLQHLPLEGGDRAALGEMARVLKPGGHLLLRTNAQAFPATADDERFQFHKYRPAELRQKLTEAGFRVLRLSRVNALLGLAELPRELRMRSCPDTYHGLVSRPRAEPRTVAALKRGWLRLEGRAVRAGVRLPFGRTLIALCVQES